MGKKWDVTRVTRMVFREWGKYYRKRAEILLNIKLEKANVINMDKTQMNQLVQIFCSLEFPEFWDDLTTG